MTVAALANDEGYPARYVGEATSQIPWGQYGIAMECENPNDIDFQPLGYEKIYRLQLKDVEIIKADKDCFQ